MSLVNDMLKDLEQRRTEQPETKEQLQWLTGQSRAHTRPWFKWLSITLLVVLLAVIAVVYQPSKSLEAENLVSAENTGGQLKEQATLLKPHLQQYRIESKGEQLHVSFEFSELPSYHVSTEAGLTTLRLKNMEATLPSQIGEISEPLRAVNIRREGEDVVVALVSDESVKQQLQGSEKPNELRVVLGLPDKPVLISNKPAVKASQSVSANKSAIADVPAVSTANITAPETKATSSTAPGAQPASVAKNTQAVKTRLPDSPVQQDKHAVTEAKNLLRRGEQAAAEQKLIAVLRKFPDAVESNQMLIALLLDQQRLEEAEQRLTYLNRLQAPSLALIQLKARLVLLQDNAKAAVALLQSQQPMIQQHPAYYELLAFAAQRDQQYALSGQVYKALLNLDAGNGDWWAGLAIAQELQGQKADARKHYAQAVQANRTGDSLRNYSRQRYLALAGAINETQDAEKTAEN